MSGGVLDSNFTLVLSWFAYTVHFWYVLTLHSLILSPMWIIVCLMLQISDCLMGASLAPQVPTQPVQQSAIIRNRLWNLSMKCLLAQVIFSKIFIFLKCPLHSRSEAIKNCFSWLWTLNDFLIGKWLYSAHYNSRFVMQLAKAGSYFKSWSWQHLKALFNFCNQSQFADSRLSTIYCPRGESTQRTWHFLAPLLTWMILLSQCQESWSK